MKHLFGCISIAFIGIACLLAGCTQESSPEDEYIQGPFRIRLEHRSDTLYMLFLDVDKVTCDSIELPYPVYRFDCGDLTGDSVPEVCVGVIKPTRYWPEGKRLFIYHLFRGRYIRPLWLGSRVGNPLIDFKVCRDSVPACIHTKECGPDSTVIRNEYYLYGFGLQFRKQLKQTDK